MIENEISKDPFEQFDVWFKKAVETNQPQANAMALATVDRFGQPSIREVLLKDFSGQGFVFFTNYQSRKSEDMVENSKAALLFFWPSMGRQVRIEGTTSKIDRSESEAYFRTRPRGSQIGAWASDQSQKIESRSFLEKRSQEFEKKYEGTDVPCPPHWGGFRLVPNKIEFWEERPNRLHDRFLYEREKLSVWSICRLSP